MTHLKLKLTIAFFMFIICLSLISCNGSSDRAGNDLSGFVVDDPVAGADVVVYDYDNKVLATGTTDTRGYYSIPVSALLASRVVVSGGTINGAPFTGTMESNCDGTEICHVTPFTTLTALAMDEYGLSHYQARKDVRRTCGISEGEDPFILEQEGLADENDMIKLDSLREELGSAAENLDAWMQDKISAIVAPYKGSVKGTVSVISPLGSAAVSVISDNYETSTAVSDDEGVWETSGSLVINDDFRVEASGGSTLYDDSFAGTLSAYIPYDPDMDLAETEIRLTILSTLIDRYMQISERTYDDAVKRVEEYLSIPEDIGLNDNMIGAYFSDIEFMDQSVEKGGFDAYIDALALHVDSGETISIGGSGNSYQIVTSTLGEKVFTGVVGGMGGAAVGFVLGKGVELLGPKIGYKSPEQITNERLAAIEATLDKMTEQLDSIDNRLTGLAASLNMTRDEIISQIYIQSVKSASGQINGLLEEYSVTLSAGKEALPGFFRDFSPRSIKNDLTAIDTGLFSQSYASGSGLTYLTSSLVEKLKNTDFGSDRNTVLENAYETLEIIFTEAMADQVKGIILLKSKLDYENGGDPTESDRYVNGVVIPLFEGQTKLFLDCVEQLIAASADVRTRVQGGGDMFPSCTQDIFYKADLLARYFYKTHDAGFIVRVVGDPKSISQFNKSPIGKNWGTPVTISSSEKFAPLPEGAGYYLGWNQDRDKRWHFSTETKIKFLKLRFASMEQNMSGRPYTCTYPYNRKVQVSYTRVDSEDGADMIPYANTFVTARAIPGFDFKNENKENQILGEGERMPYEHTANTKSAVLRAFYGQGADIPWKKYSLFSIDTQADMFFEVINDSENTIKLRLRGVVDEDILNDTGGKTPYTVQELHWQVKVGGNNMFSREYSYEDGAWAWNELKTRHKKTCVYRDGRTADWNGGGTLDVMRQIYFRASRAKSYMTRGDDLKHVDTIFKTTLECLELMPDGWPTNWKWGYSN